MNPNGTAEVLAREAGPPATVRRLGANLQLVVYQQRAAGRGAKLWSLPRRLLLEVTQQSAEVRIRATCNRYNAPTTNEHAFARWGTWCVSRQMSTISEWQPRLLQLQVGQHASAMSQAGSTLQRSVPALHLPGRQTHNCITGSKEGIPPLRRRRHAAHRCAWAAQRLAQRCRPQSPPLPAPCETGTLPPAPDEEDYFKMVFLLQIRVKTGTASGRRASKVSRQTHPGASCTLTCAAGSCVPRLELMASTDTSICRELRSGYTAQHYKTTSPSPRADSLSGSNCKSQSILTGSFSMTVVQRRKPEADSISHRKQRDARVDWPKAFTTSTGSVTKGSLQYSENMAHSVFSTTCHHGQPSV